MVQSTSIPTNFPLASVYSKGLKTVSVAIIQSTFFFLLQAVKVTAANNAAQKNAILLFKAKHVLIVDAFVFLFNR